MRAIGQRDSVSQERLDKLQKNGGLPKYDKPPEKINPLSGTA
jgi:hypothetical protein